MNGGGEHNMHGGEDRIPIAEPNSNGNQEQPLEEIVAEQLPAEEEEAVTPPGQGNRKSPVWLHFERNKVHDLWKAKCNYCRKLLG
ncbi:hypothetical protein LINPERPRIM_LOCUS37355, partial [Linum perenne]